MGGMRKRATHCAAVLAACLATDASALEVRSWTRQALLRRAAAAAAGVAGAGALQSPALALDPKLRSQEVWRIWQQQSADAVLGGELADPTGRKTLSPVLALAPIVQLRLGLDTVETLLRRRNADSWQEALSVLSAPAYSAKEIKRALNRYSDNIYIEAGSARTNAYLDGGAMPTSRETTQYLLRNAVLEGVDTLTAELAYQLREATGSSGGATAVAAGGGGGQGDDATADLFKYLVQAQSSLDDYLALAPPLDLQGAVQLARAGRDGAGEAAAGRGGG